MANTPYENFVLEDKIEDQYKSHLDLQRFCTIDNTLELTEGMKKVVHVYSASNSVKKVAQGEGNDTASKVTFASKEYVIGCAQGWFQYNDEEAMKDSQIVDAGTSHIAVDLFNTGNADIYAEFGKTTNVLAGATKIDFDLFVDLASLIPTASKTDDEIKNMEIFAFLNPKDVATLRKSARETLQYVEAYAREGYVGTIAGVNIYTKKDATQGTIVGGTKEAVTWFNKKGVEVEQKRDPNLRQNDVYGRKYYVVALTDNTKAFKAVIAG